jgi:hypothetical protein
MDQCTENYECLVINNTSNSNKLNDCVFWYKANKHEEYQIGSKQFWLNNKNEEDDNSDEEFDPSMFKSKRNNTKINVLKGN